MKTKLSLLVIIGLALFGLTALAQTPSTETPGIEDKMAPILEPVKETGISLFQKIDAWRIHQESIWRAMKTEKETQIEERTTAMYDKVDNRVDRVLEGEQASLVQGAGDDFDGSIFLLKLYTAVLAVFVIVFSSKLLFFGIVGLVLFSFVYKLVVRLRHRDQF